MDPEKLRAAKDLFQVSIGNSPSATLRIRQNRYNFPPHESHLKYHLEILRIPELSKCLSWIPFSRFENVCELGKGGFAQVYKGTVWWARGTYAIQHQGELRLSDKAVTLHYALKEVDESMVAEIVLCSLLSFGDDVNITATLVGLSLLPTTNKYLMVMRCGYTNVDNYSLLDRKSTDYFWENVHGMAKQLAHKLAHMHKLGILHYDLHPGNVVIHRSRPCDVLCIIDIGLGAVIEKSQQSQGAYGRPKYLPPESFRNKPYTTASDVYCLGTLIWELIIGAPPQGDAGTIREDGLRDDFAPGTPEVLRSLITDCWNPDPSKRPSAEAVWKILTESVINLPKLAPETRAFIEERRKSKSKHNDDDSNFYIESNLESTLNSSRFYTVEQLSQLSCRSHSEIIGGIKGGPKEENE
ncbi:kinase-like domain-containing protein [Endogone sp. FLAS-F59071]|nr:kinase-like domain-containing protein [Endogone sp. FLAS-F59071]|eukprot:RUS16532.1 kinase-like domain-containing protein [Endogone sp. FLAS-F59071]